MQIHLVWINLLPLTIENKLWDQRKKKNEQILILMILFCSRQTDLNTDWPSWAASRPVRFRIQSWPDKGCQYWAMFGPSRPDKNITISQTVSLMSSPASPGLFTLTRRVRRSEISGQRNRFGVDKDITRDINPVRWIKLSKLRDLMRSPSHCEMITGACTESDLQHSACFPDNLCIPFPEFGVKICDIHRRELLDSEGLKVPAVWISPVSCRMACRLLQLMYPCRLWITSSSSNNNPRINFEKKSVTHNLTAGHANNACIRWLFSRIEGTQSIMQHIHSISPYLPVQHMPTTLPIMCFKLHRKHGDTWNSDSSLTFTPPLVTHGSVSQLSIVPRVYSHGIMKHVQPGPGCYQSMQCCSVLQAAEVSNGKLWRALLLPLASSPNPIIPSPLFLMLSALSFTRRKCICLRFLWICKIKTSWRDAAGSLDAQCCGVLSCLNKQKNFKKAISPLLKVVHFFIITP